MAITTSQLNAMTQPGLRKINGEYPQIPTQWSAIFASGDSQMASERTLQVRFLPLPELKNQGAPTVFDTSAGQRFTYVHTHVAFGLGYAFTREAIDDDLYKSQFNPANLGLARSFKQMEEVQAAAVLNTGNVLNPAIGGDNQPLFSTSHPIDGGVVANTPSVQVGLNEGSLFIANNMIRRFRDDAGLLMSAQGRKLVVPVNLRHTAKRLMETQLRPGTANNDTWAVKENNDIQDGYVVMDFLTSDYAWFMLSSLGGLIHLTRVAFELSSQVDFTTDNLMVKAYQRYFMGYDDFRLGVGFYPTN